MLTTRGWWFFVPVFALLMLALLIGHEPLTLLCLALLFWFSREWVVFVARARLGVRQLRAQREVQDDRGPAAVLWAGQAVHVRLTVHAPRGQEFPYLLVSERLPPGVELLEGEPYGEGSLATGQPLELSYRVRCRAAGSVRFAGPGLQLADLQGFFYYRTVLPVEQTYRVLPPLVDGRGHPASVKRHNLLPPPGIHRVRRPGTSSELHDLRDYLPGDPPKTIAWKLSARRDRLITKEFESEAPVRCTLFLDTSQAVRLGPLGQNALARIVEIAAAVAQASAAARDLTGLCVFDESSCNHFLRPARGRKHLVHVLNLLANAAGLAPASAEAAIAPLLPLAYMLARAVAPESMRPELNHCPVWLPFLKPQPLGNQPAPTAADRLHRWLPFLSARRRRLYHWRKRLAALLAVRYGLVPGGLALLLEDDRQLTLVLQRFLAEYQVPYALPLYDERGRYQFASAAKIEILSAALLRSVRQAHDNELFVLLADFLEQSDALSPLLRAVQVARARHHRLLVVCPWPPAVPPPPGTAPRPGPAAAVADPALGWIGQDLQQATAARLHRAFGLMRRAFAPLGVPVLCAQSGDSVALVLERLERLRLLGRGR
jgi:uncharacterized protein (DUF58 family)